MVSIETPKPRSLVGALLVPRGCAHSEVHDSAHDAQADDAGEDDNNELDQTRYGHGGSLTNGEALIDSRIGPVSP